ncbi:MAG: CinA family nicotinamide mononucleotide deamidase-related protein [Deltaproteobacteria bacterium]|nr:CinA family nicotinamide mononucleotide deamidase-related protein [Deltaproteobacteria bacterium]
MRVEILCTGNELLDGSVVDSNSAWLEAKLFELGLEVAEKRVVPDDLGVITAAMREIAARADFCVTSGGLGPTPDDLTAEALANAAGVPLVVDAHTTERLRAWMQSRGREYGPAQSRQALVPQGAEVIDNPVGSAPHLQMKIGKCTFALLAGVPREFHTLAESHVIPRIAERFAADTGEQYAFTQLRCIGVWEADMAWAVRELPKSHPHVRIGTRTMAPENHLKLRASGPTRQEAQARLDAAVREAKDKLGTRVYALGDTTFAMATLQKLKAEGATVAFAESVSGGMAASLLAEVPGASEVLSASFVVYSERAKTALLGLDPDFITREGAVSEAVTRELALRARERAKTTYAAACTGWAGPGGGTERDPVGTFYAALATASGVTVSRFEYPRADRERIRKGAAYACLDLLRTAKP